jgi:hypothetical protein|nr:MAG TPA: hypothetical protein [Caudoviricetes sp.]
MKSIITIEQSLLYLADCTLATVSSMAMKKSKSKSEFDRQISIAQYAVDSIKAFNIQIEANSRAFQVLSMEDQKVETWAKLYKQSLKLN